MPRKTCDACNGEGTVWQFVPLHNDFTERKEVCDECHGEGEEEMGAYHFDGARVRLKSNGACGLCCAYTDHTILVVMDDEQEIAVRSFEELELCES